MEEELESLDRSGSMSWTGEGRSRVEELDRLWKEWVGEAGQVGQKWTRSWAVGGRCGMLEEELGVERVGRGNSSRIGGGRSFRRSWICGGWKGK